MGAWKKSAPFFRHKLFTNLNRIDTRLKKDHQTVLVHQSNACLREREAILCKNMYSSQCLVHSAPKGSHRKYSAMILLFVHNMQDRLFKVCSVLVIAMNNLGTLVSVKFFNIVFDGVKVSYYCMRSIPC